MSTSRRLNMGLMVAGSLLAAACETPAEKREEAKRETAQIEQAEADKQREVAEARREGTEEVREETAEAREAWKEALRAELKESYSFARRVDRRLFLIDLHMSEMRKSSEAGRTELDEVLARLEPRAKEIQKQSDEVFGLAGDQRSQLERRIEAELTALENDVIEARAKAKVQAGT